MMVPVLIIAIVLIIGAGVLVLSDRKPKGPADGESTSDSQVQSLASIIATPGTKASPAAEKTTELIEILKPGPNKRVCGYLIDLLVIGVILLFFSGNAVRMTVASVYWLLRDSLKGQSVGKRLLGMRVLNQQNAAGGPMDSFIRNIPMVIPFFNLVEYFAMRKNVKGKRIGDLIAHTQVEDTDPNRTEKRYFLYSIPLAFLTMGILAGPFFMQTLDRIQMVVEPGTDFINYYERALAEYPKNPQKASLISLKAEVFGTYDLMRVDDPNAQMAWGLVQKEFLDIRKWSMLNPIIYRQNLRDVMRWAKKQTPPSYPPLWVARFGIMATGQNPEGMELKVGRNAQHDPAKDWADLMESYTYLADDEVTWRDLQEQVEPENAKASLQELKDQLVEGYGRVLDEPSKKEFEGHIQQMIDGFSKKKGSIGDKIMAVTTDIELYLEGVDARIMPQKQ